MRIMFVNPPFSNYGLKKYEWATTPLSLGYLASYLIEKGLDDITIFDIDALGSTYEEAQVFIRKKDPELIAVSVSTLGYFRAVEFSEMAKSINPAIRVVFGGYHPSVLPRDTLKEKTVDFVIVGEGEITLYELVKEISGGKKDFGKIDGLGFKKGRDIIINSPRKLIEDLDELPFPARHLMPHHLYKRPSISTARGCPFKCNFCYSPTLWSGVRFRSVTSVVDEIEELVNTYKSKHIAFVDDTFTANEKRAIGICREIRKRKLEVKWICWSRADTLSKRLVREMKLAGCYQISFGLESGNQEILDSLQKGTKLEQAYDAINIVVNEGIKARASFMIGNIGEDKKSIRKTIDFAKRLKLYKVVFNIPYPLPGTGMYEKAVKLDYLEEPDKWSEYTIKGSETPLMSSKYVSNKELLRLQKKAYREFYLRPSYMVRFLFHANLREIKNMLGGIRLYLGI